MTNTFWGLSIYLLCFFPPQIVVKGVMLFDGWTPVKGLSSQSWGKVSWQQEPHRSLDKTCWCLVRGHTCCQVLWEISYFHPWSLHQLPPLLIVLAILACTCATGRDVRRVYVLSGPWPLSVCCWRSVFLLHRTKPILSKTCPLNMSLEC